MLKNNIEVDVKVKCIEAETTQAKLAEDVGTTPSYVNRLIKRARISSIRLSFRCWNLWDTTLN